MGRGSKPMIIAILAFAAVQFVSSGASPPPLPPTNGGEDFVGRRGDAVNLAYEREAEALRTEMHLLQERDGGELTAQHRAYVQEKAALLLSTYRRDIQRVDPMAVNADGSNRH